MPFSRYEKEMIRSASTLIAVSRSLYPTNSRETGSASPIPRPVMMIPRLPIRINPFRRRLRSSPTSFLPSW